LAAVDSLQISAKTARRKGRPRGRSFTKGQSGNPAGRPPGRRNNATLAIEALFDGEAEALGRKAVELALAGNTLALKLCLDRLAAPCRDRPVAFALPRIAGTEDLAAAMAAIAEATAAGELTPSEAFDLARVAERFLAVIAARDAERAAAAAARRNAESRAAMDAMLAAEEAAASPEEQAFRRWLDGEDPEC
jgi:uncharacterized protein DUF5681